MQIGQLNKLVTIQYPTVVPDAMGGFTDTWVQAATAWAAIWPTSAKETVESNSLAMVVSHKIRIRHRSVFKPEWRIKFGNRYFSIVSIINPNEKNEWLDLMCKEAT